MFSHTPFLHPSHDIYRSFVTLLLAINLKDPSQTMQFILWVDQGKAVDQTLLARNLHSDEQNVDSSPR